MAHHSAGWISSGGTFRYRIPPNESATGFPRTSSLHTFQVGNPAITEVGPMIPAAALSSIIIMFGNQVHLYCTSRSLARKQKNHRNNFFSRPKFEKRDQFFTHSPTLIFVCYMKPLSSLMIICVRAQPVIRCKILKTMYTPASRHKQFTPTSSPTPSHTPARTNNVISVYKN